ncbi:MAG: SRPBCC domain-containing protein, partial [Chloroflexota bacterium]|nr:SRPBCC domain-containing protein [Chloroflexota bacterium]
YLEGEIVEIEPPHRLVHTFHVIHHPDAARDRPSRVTWEITPMGDACRLRLTHDEMDEATQRYVEGGWELILSGLKTLLETGQPLKVGEPATM